VIEEQIEPLQALARWEHDLDRLRVQYAAAEPYPHIVLDGALAPEMFARCVAEFPPRDGAGWINYVHVNETKFGNTRAETWGPSLQTVVKSLTAPRFVRFLEGLTGIDDLLADRTMDGGGLHQTLPGGHLNVHADFTAHHTVPGWRRRLNVLLYLNPEWRPEWGGDLELWAPDMSRAVEMVAPIGNRLMVFTTDEQSFHGHPEALTCPEGVSRQSLALYFFTAEDHPMFRSTNYQARPGDGFKKVAIYVDKGALRAYDVFKRRLRFSDQRISRLLRRGR